LTVSILLPHHLFFYSVILLYLLQLVGVQANKLFLQETPIQPVGAKDIYGSIEVLEEYAERSKGVEGFSDSISV
jgi:hypothetical protein